MAPAPCGGAFVRRGIALDLARGRLRRRLNPLPPTVTSQGPPSTRPQSARRSRSSQVKVDSTAAATLESYFNFGAYAIISSVIVSVGLVFSGMNEPERVRRMDASPVSERQRSLAVFAAAAVLTVCIWLVSSMMGVVGFAGAVAEVGVGRVCLALAATFALACTPLAVGFTLSSLGAREELLNGVGNLLGLLMTFLGGAWMPLSLMGPAVQTAAHFVPTYWVNDAIGKALASDLTSAVLGDIACDLGVTVLFAAAIAAVGLALAYNKSRA